MEAVFMHPADGKVTAFDDAPVEYDRLRYAYSDPDEVAKWLNRLAERRRPREMPLVGAHGNDRQRLIKA